MHVSGRKHRSVSHRTIYVKYRFVSRLAHPRKVMGHMKFDCRVNTAHMFIKRKEIANTISSSNTTFMNKMYP